MLGDRHRGLAGAVAAVLGLLGAPLLILVGFATLYTHFASVPQVKAGLSGAAAAAAGLVLGTSLKILKGLQPDAVTWFTAASVCLAAAFPPAPDGSDPRRGYSRIPRHGIGAQAKGMSIIGQLARTFGVLSLLSVGGANATLPEIHRQVVGAMHWMSDATFANLVAIGQTAPGPNVLIVSMIGWHMAGVPGMLVATLAVVLPSAALALVLGRLMTRYAALEWIALARKALAPIAVGLHVGERRDHDQGKLRGRAQPDDRRGGRGLGCF